MNNAKIDMPHDEEGWKQKLTPEQYAVLREKGTEPAFSGKLLHEDKDGIYKCAACGNPLFSSDAKFDSGTGWPSFDQALPGAVEFKADTSYGMHRTEILCAQCGSHLGHLFDDGPTQTGKRYCLNSVCLDLEPDLNNKK
jgi:peptide-methionine (R)-S-oxide reductase